MNALIAVAVKSLLLAGLTLIALRLARGRSAADRSWIAHIGLLALLRLFALRARADVLVDSHWLSALARAQKRMGFKHGTALLTSNDLPSPISWGVMRPVILLNSRAVDAADEAEAIIAHELAHVARLDWAKLLLARVATALFWFNPLVWLIAREAHQLREEAADDTVLAADIEDTDYAQLLVGVARHECNGMLLGAHGVAPSKNSLSRRVARVLDQGLARGPLGKSFAAGVFVGALAIATPLAAVSLVPGAADGPAGSMPTQMAGSRTFPAGGVPIPAPVSTTVNSAVTTAVASALGIVDPKWGDEIARTARQEAGAEREQAIAEANRAVAQVSKANWSGVGPKPGTTFGPKPGTVFGPKPGTVFGPQPGSVGPHARPRDEDAIDQAIALKAVGATAEYARSIQAAAPALRRIAPDDLIALKAVGVSAAYIRELADAGVRNLDADTLIELRAVGVHGEYVRGLANAGYPNLSPDKLVEMRAVGVTPDFIRRLGLEGLRNLKPDQLIDMTAVSHIGPGRTSREEDRDEDDDGG